MASEALEHRLHQETKKSRAAVTLERFLVEECGA
jgi:hypothetical protein